KRALTQKDALNRQTTYSYSDCCGGVANETTRVTDARGYVTEHVYDVGGQLVRETQAVGTPSAASWTYTYDPYVLGRTSATDPNNHTRAATYDQRGNVTSTTSALNRTTSMTYDSLNDLTSYKDGKGTTTTYTFDARGNLVSFSTPLLQSSPVQNQAVTYTYGDPSHPGDLTSVTDPKGNSTTYTYDAAGNVASVTNAVGGKTTYTYDSLGRGLTMVSPRGNVTGADPAQYTTRYSYDAAGNRLSVTDPLGHQTSYTYDNDGNLLTVTDANSNATTYTYDAANQLTEITRADGSIIRSSYDAVGNLASQTDGAGKTTSYAYSALGHQVSAADPLNRTTNYSVDAVGNVRSIVDPLSRTTAFTYNADSEVTAVAFSDGTTPSVSYGYDSNGERTSMTDGTGSWSYTYDSLRRLTNVVNGRGATTSFGYDLANNQTSVTYPNGKTITRTFDNAERIQTIRDWLGNTTTFDYTPDSQLATVTFPASTANVDTYTYDNAGQTVGIAMARGSTTLASLAYGRDSVGQLQSETPTGLPGAAQSYGYDQLNRLVNSGSFAYDAADNPTTLAGVSGFTYDAANQLQSGPAGAYSYNGLGQRTGFTPTGAPASSHVFDQAGRLTSVSGAASASYAYDGDGLRASKTVGATTQYFTWDESSKLPRLLSDGAVSYIYGPDGTPLEQIDAADNVRFYHHDQLGSTRLLTDAAGSAVASFTYDAYGALSGSTGTATTPLGFASQYTDAETGLIYMRARYYDPATAQFLSRDPIEQLTRQPYGYVSGNPLNAIDPSGLACWTDPLDCARDFGRSVISGASDVGHAAVSGAIAVGNYTAGFAHGLTGGYSTKLLNAVGIRPDTCSALFQGAIPMGLIGGLFVPGLGELRAVQAGIYIVRTARGIYVGQSGQISVRLARHVRTGKFTQAEADAAERVSVRGDRIAREIAEQQKIDELGGIDLLLNERNVIGPNRFHLMPAGYSRP
ncbi:MAG: RHS repeat-associated core domain-containing protein, partial [Gaiellaceae bacterium]